MGPLESRRVNPRGLSRPRRSAPAGSVADFKIVSDPIDAAEEAGLRYVSDDQPGYRHGFKTARQYSGNLPKMLCSSGYSPSLSGWKFDRRIEVESRRSRYTKSL
jgi:hypothetical protein